MIKRMSFGSLKASFSRRSRRRPRSTAISLSDVGVQPATARTCVVAANGVTGGVENKAAAAAVDSDVGSTGNEADPKQQRSCTIKTKHKGGTKKNGGRGGIWKTLRHKLSRNHRQCWDAGGSNTDLDLDSGDASSAPQYRNNIKAKPSSVCPMPTGIQHPANVVGGTPSLHVRPSVPVVSSNEEGVYDEPTFPNVNGSGAPPSSADADGAKGSSSKTKTKTGDCCQPSSKNRLEYASPGQTGAASRPGLNVQSNKVGVVGIEFGGVDDGPTSPCLSTPAHECHNVVSRLNSSCAFASMSSFNSQTSSAFMLDFRLENGNSNNNTPKIRSLTRELFKLSKYGWYWGPITRTEAEEKLMDQPDGAFLVRDSSDDRHLLSLSFRSYGKTLHTRIEHCNGLFSFYAQPEPEGHASIVDLIEHSMNYSQSGAFCYSRARSPGSPSFPVRLTKPVSRFTQVRTLQYLCRFIIRQYTRFDHIQELPLPSRIKGYIEEGHY